MLFYVKIANFVQNERKGKSFNKKEKLSHLSSDIEKSREKNGILFATKSRSIGNAR